VGAATVTFGSWRQVSDKRQPDERNARVAELAGRAWSEAGWQAHVPNEPDPGALAEELGARPIPVLAAESAGRVPDRVAIAIGADQLTHGALDDAAARVSAWLGQRVAPGDRILFAAASSLDMVCGYLGALRAGAVVVLANPAYTATELGHLLLDSGARLALADPGPAQRLSELADAPPVVGIASLRALASGPADAGVRARPDDLALLAYTSGTTGRPKGVPLTHRQLATSIRSAMAAWRWSADDVLVHSLPLFHQHGLGGVHATLIAGSSAYIRPRFSAADLAGTARSARASVLFAVPTIYQELADAFELAGATAPALPGLRLAVCGSAPLSPALAGRLPDLLGQLPLIRYGTTESGLDVSHPYADRSAGTVGVPLPGVLARVCPDAMAAGSDGEIQLRGPQVFGGYWRDPAATEAAFTLDGWFRTGDVGAIDPASGHLVIRARMKEMIISGGLNVYPREIEMALEAHPGVAEAVVAGTPHERWGEQVTAWVVVRAGHAFDEKELIAHTRSLLAPYKCPKRVYLLAALPRTSLGKVVRSALTPID
jgi:acyl-CoA synthetase (AMP-forming)/AMP-acid ligase II